MQMTPARLLRALTLTAGLALTVTPGTAPAQNLFAPAITVDEMVITGYEIEQRRRMMTLLNAPGNVNELSREQLIDDRLRLKAAREAGIEPSEQDILDGMDEFAGRADLSREQFVAQLNQGGVDEETFRDFVRAGTAWRELVRAQFASRTQVTPEEVDRALASGGSSSDVRVLLSEIIMPINAQNAESVQARAERISQMTSTADFSAQARQYSATATRDNGGRLPWRDLTELPPQIRSLVLGLAPGEVTDPLPIQGAVALFQLRDIEETSVAAPTYAEIEYAAYYIPGGRTEPALAQAAQIRGRIDTCDDLYGIAKGQPAEVLERVKKAPSDIPQDVAIELSKLDTGEVSTTLTRANGQTLMLLMMCGRTAAANASAPASPTPLKSKCSSRM